MVNGNLVPCPACKQPYDPAAVNYKRKCVSCTAKWREYGKKRLAKATELGLCRCMRQAPIPGCVQCELCLSKNRKSAVRLKKMKLAAGLCSCGKPPSPGYTKCKQCLQSLHVYNRQYKQMVLDVYGNECECCGETNFFALTIDHVNNDGAEHRRRDIAANGLYRWLINNDYPKAGFQTLCFGCNMSKHRNGGQCHHVAERKEKHKKLEHLVDLMY